MHTPCTRHAHAISTDDTSQACPMWLLLTLCFSVPCAVGLALAVLSPARGTPQRAQTKDQQAPVQDYYSHVCASSPWIGAVRAHVVSLLWALGVNELVVGAIKKYCGYWRPYYYAECAAGLVGGAGGGCTGDALRSFPSGHAASSMAALLHTSLRLAGAARLGGGGGGGGGTLPAAGGSPRDSPVTTPAGLMVTAGMTGEVALGFWARGESVELRLLGCMAPACVALWVGTPAPQSSVGRGLSSWLSPLCIYKAEPTIRLRFSDPDLRALLPSFLPYLLTYLLTNLLLLTTY